MSAKVGRSFGNFSQTFLTAAWAREGFKARNKKGSFLFELGLGLLFSNFKEGDFYYEEPGTQPLIYWKLHWNFYGG